MPAAPEIRRASCEGDVAAAIAVRRAVFVQEQGGPEEEEPDERDGEALHYLVQAWGRPVGAARLLDAGPGTARIGRVCILKEARGNGWGSALIRYVIADASRLGAREVVLDAQVRAAPFYERLGFAAEGEVFEDAGIPHRRMRRRLQ